MRAFGKIFTIAILLFLIGVNFASAIPAGKSGLPLEEKTEKISMDSEELISADEPEIEEEPINPISYGPGDPEPLGNSVEVDALGPYGTPASPYYEGDTIDFQADIIDGNETDYYYRWDVDNDGLWETFFKDSPKGDYNYSYTFLDDYNGQAKVQAWDGVSYISVTGNGTIFNESLPTRIDETVNYRTMGFRFTPHQDITVLQMGAFNESYIRIYNIRLWTGGGSLLSQILDPLVPNGAWEWFNNVPLALYAGNDYIISIGFQGREVPATRNPGKTPDEVIEPTESRFYYGSWGFPLYSGGETFLPLVDIRYEYYYQHDSIEDYADVYVENVPPTPDAGADIITMVGDRIDFFGSFYDPGLFDTHDILWNFGDGFGASGRLDPSHIYNTPGEYTVTLRIVDDDGGVGFDSLTVIVKDTREIEEKIEDLMKIVESLNLPQGLENALISKLENALDAYQKGNYNAALNKIMAFILHVGAQEGKKIPSLYAEELIESAKILRDLLLEELG
jgi:PKD repeat protein